MRRQSRMGITWDKSKANAFIRGGVFSRKRILAVLQEMLALAQTPSSLVFLLTEKLLSLIPDHQRRVQTVGGAFRQTVLRSSVSFPPNQYSGLSIPGSRDHL